MTVRARAHRARARLRIIRGAPSPVDEASDGPRSWWYRRYTRLICDFMSDLPDEELGRYEQTFTALHELVGHAFTIWTSREDVVTERQAWARFDVGSHIAFARMFSLNPPDVDPALFCELFVRFVRFLAERQAMDESDGRRLQAEYEALAACVRHGR